MRHTSLPVQSLPAWAHLNNVKLLDTTIAAHIIDEDGNDKGGGLQAIAQHDAETPFVAVPLNLVLSKEHVEQCAKADQSLNELIEAASSLFQTPRTAVLLFLVYEMTINSPDAAGVRLGYTTPFADYVKLLPHQILLPTFYTAEEKELLTGTSLSQALTQKMNSLEREFETLKAATSEVTWCQKSWWDDTTGCLTFQDWLLADAMYRSRALELPRGAGLGMVPVVDMANHASDNRYNARFEVDEETESVLLVTRDDKTVDKGEEITIMYGCGGACEMIFSYGFLEEHASSAREMFLPLAIPADDPLRVAKVEYAREAPGVRIYVDDSNQVQWDSTFVWWACVNREDGLDFRVERTIDGDMDLRAQWKDGELDAGTLHSVLMEDRLRDVFALRAVVMIQQTVELQGQQLAASEDNYNDTRPSDQVRSAVYHTIGKLRTLEMELLATAYQSLETEKATLLESAVVQEYLERGQDDQDGETPDDFS